MATYIPQVQDKVEKVHPPETNWQFEAQLLSTRQAKYDAGHKKLSDLYGKILNAGLTRENNIEAREEFFKLIDQDLRKIAGIDLSKESNVTQAQQVFNQVYENDYLVKDMVWTKNFQNEMKRSEGFKNCVDHEKCGGRFWEDGVKYMNYKRDEFKNMTNDESLGFGNVRYIPYNNLMEQAIKDAKEAGLDVTIEQLDKDGKYQITTKNGQNVIQPLTQMFGALYAKNPEFQDVYKVMAYNKRKDWTYNAVRSGEFKTLEEAAAGYVQNEYDKIEKDFEKMSRGVKNETETLQKRYDAYLKDAQANKLKPADLIKMQETEMLLAKSKEVDAWLDVTRNAKKNLHSQSSMNAIGEWMDQAYSSTLFEVDLHRAAGVLSNRDKSITMEEDKFAIQEAQFQHDIYMENLEHQHSMEEIELKAALGAYSGNKSDVKAIKQMKQEQAWESAENYDFAGNLLSKLKDDKSWKAISTKDNLNADMTQAEAEAWANKVINDPKASNQVKAAVKKHLGTVKTDKHNKRVTANIRALEAVQKGVDPGDMQWDWDIMTPADIKNLPADLVEFTPLASQYQAYFASGSNKGVAYVGKKSGNHYVKDPDGKYWVKTQGADPFAESSWTEWTNPSPNMLKPMSYDYEHNYY
jgi:hypothetical protein